MNIKKSKKNISFMPYLILVAVIISTYVFLNTIGTKVNNITYTELTTELEKDNVKEIAVTPKSGAGVYVITGKLKDGAKNETFSVTVPYTDTVISTLYETAEGKGLNVETNTNPENSAWITILVNFLPILLFGVIAYMMLMKLGNGNKGTFDFGKSKAKLADEQGRKTFKDRGCCSINI